MHLVMFDIDGTLIQSNDFDTDCFQASVKDVLNTTIATNWDKYHHATDSGILNQIITALGLSAERERIVSSVKKRFIELISIYVEKNGVSPVCGASAFLSYLLDRNDVRVAIATGGWHESARLKLKAAHIDTRGIAFASSSDHFNRIEIMKTAESRCGNSQYKTKTYFGDAPWDLKASEALGYNFILIGERMEYSPSFHDYSAVEDITSTIGL